MSETLTGDTSPKPSRLSMTTLVVVFLASVVYAILFNAGWRFVVAVMLLAGLLSVIVPYLFRLGTDQ